MQGSLDQFTGCMLGLATGDALGAPYEGGLLERLVCVFWAERRDGGMPYRLPALFNLRLRANSAAWSIP